MCQNCYLAKYYRDRKDAQRKKKLLNTQEKSLIGEKEDQGHVDASQTFNEDQKASTDGKTSDKVILAVKDQQE